MRVIQANLKAAQSRQKSYFDKRRKPLQFQVGDHVYLRVSPIKGVQRFGVKGKLAPRYVGPYEITEICGPVAYKVRLPPQSALLSLNALLMLLLCMCMCKYTTFARLVWNFPNYSSNKLFPKTKVVGFGELSNFHVNSLTSKFKF